MLVYKNLNVSFYSASLCSEFKIFVKRVYLPKSSPHDSSGDSSGEPELQEPQTCPKAGLDTFMLFHRTSYLAVYDFQILSEFIVTMGDIN